MHSDNIYLAGVLVYEGNIGTNFKAELTIHYTVLGHVWGVLVQYRKLRAYRVWLETGKSNPPC